MIIGWNKNKDIIVDIIVWFVNMEWLIDFKKCESFIIYMW